MYCFLVEKHDHFRTRHGVFFSLKCARNPRPLRVVFWLCSLYSMTNDITMLLNFGGSLRKHSSSFDFKSVSCLQSWTDICGAAKHCESKMRKSISLYRLRFSGKIGASHKSHTADLSNCLQIIRSGARSTSSSEEQLITEVFWRLQRKRSALPGSHHDAHSNISPAKWRHKGVV